MFGFLLAIMISFVTTASLEIRILYQVSGIRALWQAASSSFRIIRCAVDGWGCGISLRMPFSPPPSPSIWTHQLPVPLSNQLQVSSLSCVLIVLPCLCYRPASAGWPEKLMPPHILFHHT